MIIRSPLTAEVFALVEIMTSLHPLTRFDELAVDEKYARQLLAQVIQRNDGQHVGGCFIRVAEDDGKLVGFIVGMLDRVYHICDRLWAQDMFFATLPDAPMKAASLLLDAYVDWGRTNPKVHEIHLSHLDAFPQQERLDRHYERRGFIRCGSVFRFTKGGQS